jgi:hypothetical protein
MRLAAAVLVCIGCGSPEVPNVRFANAPPVRVVDDRRDVPAPPAEHRYYWILHDYDATVHRPIARALELRGPQRALGVNAYDEVPDSTWFTNRIGVRELTLDEVRAGAATGESPEHHLPWTIVRNKQSGEAAGFVVRDSRGVEHLLKLEDRGHPEAETGAAVITGRLLWAAGYNVPEEHVVYFHPRDLVVSAASKHVDGLGVTRPLTARDVERVLARTDIAADGRVRGLASRLIAGKPLGGHPTSGRRADDPNDRIPHERRRDLRGAYAFFAWLDHVDAKDANTLDVWIADPRDPSRHYVQHYLLDFGKSLGVAAMTSPNKRIGHAYSVDPGDMFRSLATGGLGQRRWDDREATNLRGVGLFGARSFDPGAWKPATPGYLPFLVADARDNLWAAKILMRFTPAQLRAAVDAARFTDPRAAEYITATLIARQRATARYWFDRASPLDRFATAGDALCFVDLRLSYALAPAAQRYEITRYDRRGRPFASAFEMHANGSAETCIPAGLAGDRDGYTIFRITTTGRIKALSIYVHVARDPRSGQPRVIGIWRA